MQKNAALLSFFLPGLGQLSQKRLAWALGFFCCFTLAATLPFNWWTVPLIALGAGLEALRFRNVPGVSPPPANRYLRTSYAIVAAMGFFAWVSLFLDHFAFAANLEELKKADFSIRLGAPAGREVLKDRCFLRPAVNQALVRVQQKLKVLGAGLQVMRCYEPKEVRFGRGAAVQIRVFEEGKASSKQLAAAMVEEGFEEKDKGKGIFIHRSWKKSEVEDVSIETLP